jgi:hypothetical protein
VAHRVEEVRELKDAIEALEAQRSMKMTHAARSTPRWNCTRLFAD